LNQRRGSRRCECRFLCGSVFAWLGLRVRGLDCVSVGSAFRASIWLFVAMVLGYRDDEKRPRVGITDPDWQRIESAYGQKLSPQARRDIQGRTQKFVDRDEFEQNAEPVSDARDQIAIVIGAASSLRYRSAESTMPIFTCAASSESISGSRVAKKQKAGHAIKRRRRKKTTPFAIFPVT